MRKTILALAIFSFCFFKVSAQTEKGRWDLSAKTDMNLMFGETSRVTDSVPGEKIGHIAFNANPGVAYFILNNLSVGISGSFQYLRTENDNFLGYSHQYVIGVSPFVTYYIPLKGKLKPNISVGAGYNWLYTSELDAEGPTLSVAPGISYFVNRNISLDLGVQYTYKDLKNNYREFDFKYKQQYISILAGLSVYF